MAIDNHIRNPVEWTADQIGEMIRVVGSAGRTLRLQSENRSVALPAINKISITDLRDILARGLDDLAAYRTDAIFLAAIYPLAGIVLGWAALNNSLLPLVFPLASGFALVGPVAALGLYELSRRREQESEGALKEASSTGDGPAVGAIIVLALVMLAIFALWLAVAYAIYLETLGPEAPTSIGSFVHDVFTTNAGWTMIVVGIGVGFLFAALALTIGVISFPLLIDRNVGPYTALATSVRAVKANPLPMAVWGMIVAAGLVIGSIPALIGLVVVMPVLGHATWHLYRRVVAC
jgi:uncharacterized membrane protein